MRFTIVGSGGCCALPRPGCFCKICEEAREKGAPYARFGPALYCHEAKTLVDSPFCYILPYYNCRFPLAIYDGKKAPYVPVNYLK